MDRPFVIFAAFVLAINTACGAVFFLWLALWLTLKAIDLWTSLSEIGRYLREYIWYRKRFIAWMSKEMPGRLSEGDRRRFSEDDRQ